jgi:peroxiredoxin
MKSVLPIILTVLFAATLLAGCGTPAPACPKIGDRAPDFTLSGIDGKNVSLNNFTGKPVVINTWDVACIRCKEEMPFFQKLYDQYAQDRVIFLSIDTGRDSTSSIKDYLKQNNFTFNVLQDYGNKVFKPKYCFVEGNPCTVFIDADGIIKYIKIGSFATKQELDNTVLSLIAP